MPMLTCPGCGIRQYAAASHVAYAQCVVCESRLAAPKSPDRPFEGPGRRGRFERERPVPLNRGPR